MENGELEVHLKRTPCVAHPIGAPGVRTLPDDGEGKGHSAEPTWSIQNKATPIVCQEASGTVVEHDSDLPASPEQCSSHATHNSTEEAGGGWPTRNPRMPPKLKAVRL